MSDHRPVLASYSSIVAQGLVRALPMSSVRRASSISAAFIPRPSNFANQAGLDASWVRLESLPPSLAQAEAQLRHLTTTSLDSSPPLKKWKVRNKYKEHWSPTYAALQAQLLAMLRIQRHLGVLPLPRRSSPWSTPFEIQRGIANTTHDWERTVASLTFHGGIPPEVWGIGLTPQEWRTQNVSQVHNLRLAAISTSKLLRDHLHARKRKEFAVRVSRHVATREEKYFGCQRPRWYPVSTE